MNVPAEPAARPDSPAGLAHTLAGPLRIFTAVARLEHVSAAADDLALPQSTVTRTIQRIETAAGTPLFDRIGRRLRLTSAGRALADATTGASTTIDAACARHHRDSDLERGLVRLAFLHSLGSPQVPLLVAEFRERYPLARFDLRQHTHRGCVDLLESGAVDLALLAPPPEGPGLVTRVLYRQPLCLAVHPTHPFAARGRVRMGELLDDDFVSFARGIGLREYTQRLAAASGFSPRIVCQTQDADTARGLVAAGLGVAVVPSRSEVAHRNTARLPDVIELELEDAGAVREMALVWRADGALAPMASALRDLVLAAGAEIMGFQPAQPAQLAQPAAPPPRRSS
ncbi:LysR family transcriptional regulator [Micrococcales bacterium 31B]|nr:LysR family transcriptional regulator [Micrococcales bacterium 31B]